ncbi:MAG: recombination protein RecR [Bacteroidales bacterium]|nr:recombination protein RecR [Bacteroidales bacterium]
MLGHIYSSKLLENAVNEFSKLPGIGKKTALRLVLFLLRQNKDEVQSFGDSIIKLHNEIKYCRSCNNISDTDLCKICANQSRDHSTICIVENIRDVLSIENTQQYHGIYHVLGCIISPIDGFGPGDLMLKTLETKIKNEEQVKEIILALPTTMEGDTTNFYLYRKFKDSGVKISTLARGVSIGDDLEYADEITLGRSIINRTLFESSFSS